jgi:hypothetical protein
MERDGSRIAAIANHCDHLPKPGRQWKTYAAFSRSLRDDQP